MDALLAKKIINQHEKHTCSSILDGYVRYTAQPLNFTGSASELQEIAGIA